MAHILITGINGYLGSHLARKLCEGNTVVGLSFSGNNLERITGLPIKVWSVKNGLPEDLFQQNSFDVIIHTATAYGRNGENVADIAKANLFEPFKLLETAIFSKVPLFINTDTVVDRFLNAYALTKRQFQEWLFFRSSEIQVINMQLEHFYGPNGSDSNFITSLFKRMSANEPVIALTAGQQMRDFIYIDDVVDAFGTVIEHSRALKKKYSDFEVATGAPVKLRSLIEQIKNITGSSSQLDFGAIPYRPNEMMLSTANPAELMELGWKPKTSLLEGLQRCIVL